MVNRLEVMGGGGVSYVKLNVFFSTIENQRPIIRFGVSLLINTIWERDLHKFTP